MSNLPGFLKIFVILIFAFALIPTANAATTNVSKVRGNGSAFVPVQANSAAQYFLNANTATAGEIYDSSGAYSSSVGTASSINIYYAGNKFEIENKMGATRDLSLTVIQR